MGDPLSIFIHTFVQTKGFLLLPGFEVSQVSFLGFIYTWQIANLWWKCTFYMDIFIFITLFYNFFHLLKYFRSELFFFTKNMKLVIHPLSSKYDLLEGPLLSYDTKEEHHVSDLVCMFLTFIRIILLKVLTPFFCAFFFRTPFVISLLI